MAVDHYRIKGGLQDDLYNSGRIESKDQSGDVVSVMKTTTTAGIASTFLVVWDHKGHLK